MTGRLSDAAKRERVVAAKTAPEDRAAAVIRATSQIKTTATIGRRTTRSAVTGRFVSQTAKSSKKASGKKAQ